MLITPNSRFYTQLRGPLDEPPFLRILCGFRSLLTINRHSSPEKILASLRWHFSLMDSSLPIVLYGIKTDEEIFLTDEKHHRSVLIHHGIYLALLQYDQMRYLPLIDLSSIPTELFPEKTCLPNRINFLLYEIQPFTRLLINLVDYMIDEEKSHVFRPYPSREMNTSIIKKDLTSSPSRKTIQLSIHRKLSREKSLPIPNSNSVVSPDTPSSTPLSVSSMPSTSDNDHRIDIQKYTVTDLQRLNCNANHLPSLPFSFQIQHSMMQSDRPILRIRESKMDSTDMIRISFDENELILFKYHLNVAPLESSSLLKLFNCIHQLAIDQQLGQTKIIEILHRIDQRLRHFEFHDDDVEKTIRDLQNAAIDTKRKEISRCNLSNLMKILIRIEQLARYRKLEMKKVHIFNERLYHLARLGAVNPSSKLCKKLTQIDLYGSEHLHQLSFNQFVDDELQHYVPKPLPLNALGIEEILHHFRINIDRLGPTVVLMLIDNLQRLVHCGLLFTLHKTSSLKNVLMQLIEHVQSSRLNGVYLQRLFEQINTIVGFRATKKAIFANQLNSFLQKMKSKDKTEQNQLEKNYQVCLTTLMKLADQAKLHTVVDTINDVIPLNQISHDHRSLFAYSSQDCCNPLQSLLVFLSEQTLESNKHVDVFIRYLRHLAELGLLDHPPFIYLISELHRTKEKGQFQLEFLIHMIEQMKNINYTHVYSHLNLPDLDQFLSTLMVNDELTHGQCLYLLDRFSHLCQYVPITDYALSQCLRLIQLEYARQQGSFKKWIDAYHTLINSYSKSSNELHWLEKELNEIFSSPTNLLKRIPEELRRRLHEISNLCRILNHHSESVDELFSSTINIKFYEKMKDMIKTKTFLNRKQSLTAVIQIHKHFLQFSKDFATNVFSAEQIDSILSVIQEKCPQERASIETALKHLAELGYLQDKTLIDFLMEHIVSKQSAFWTIKESACLRRHLQHWPLKLNLHHRTIQQIVQHLTRLESNDRLDVGTSIEIQNRLNQLARLTRYSQEQIQSIVTKIFNSSGQRNLIDRDGFEKMQSYRLSLNDILHAIELEVQIQKWTFEHRFPYQYNYRFREYLYQILQQHQPIGEFHRIKRLDINQIKRWIDSFIPNNISVNFPLSLTDQIFAQLKWDGKRIDRSQRDQLLRLEHHGILSRETYENIYHHIHQTSDLSLISSSENQPNQLHSDLIKKINDLQQTGQISLQQSIQIKEQVTFIESILDQSDQSACITIQSRLLNASNDDEWKKMSDELNEFASEEQFRLSKATDLIKRWNLNENRLNGTDKKIWRLFRELAQINRLYDPSSPHYFQHYIDMKSVHPSTHRQLIRDLERIKAHALTDRQATTSIRLLEARLSKFDSKRRLTDSLMIKCEMRLKQIFQHLSRPSDEAIRTEIVKDLGDLLERHVKSTTTMENNTLEEHRFEELIDTFDLHIAQHTKSGPLRRSKTNYPIISSDIPIVKLSPSLQSLESLP